MNSLSVGLCAARLAAPTYCFSYPVGVTAYARERADEPTGHGYTRALTGRTVRRNNLGRTPHGFQRPSPDEAVERVTAAVKKSAGTATGNEALRRE